MAPAAAVEEAVKSPVLLMVPPPPFRLSDAIIGLFSLFGVAGALVVTRAMGDFVRIQDATAALTLRQVAGTLRLPDGGTQAVRWESGDLLPLVPPLGERGGRQHPQQTGLDAGVALGASPAAEPEAPAVSRVAGKVVVVTGAGQGQGAADECRSGRRQG